MVTLDSRKRKLSHQLSTTPLKKQKQIDDDHIHKMSFFSLPQLNKKSEQNTIPLIFSGHFIVHCAQFWLSVFK
jgi:hypothetical protein